MTRVLLVPALMLAVLLPGGARAESYASCAGFIDSLPATLSTQGVWCLRRDLGTALASGQAIDIVANNVTIDCNHFKLGGIQAGLSTQTTGIRASARLNATVRNCHIRGFRTGVDLSGGGHAVLDSRFDGNTAVAVSLSGDGGLVQGNRINDTGGATFASGDGLVAGIAVGAGGVSITGNHIHGVAADTEDVQSRVAAIYLRDAGHGTVADNSASLILSRGSAFAGIWSTNDATSRLIIRDNNLSNESAEPGSYQGAAIYCAGNDVIKDNVVSGFSFANFAGCIDGGGNVDAGT